MPQPPLTMTLDPGTQTAVLAFMGFMATLSLIYMLAACRKRGDLVPIFIFLGSAIAIFYEPLADYLVLVYYPENGQISAISGFNRDIPLYLYLAYFWYFPPFAVHFLDWVKRGVSPAKWWTAWFGFLGFAIVFEELFIKLGMWTYYGPHPIRIIDLPLWVPFTFMGFAWGVPAGIYALVKFLPKSSYWLIVPAVPVLMSGAHAALSLPGAYVLNTYESTSLHLLGTSLSIGLALLMSHTLAILCCQPQHAEVAASSQMS